MEKFSKKQPIAFLKEGDKVDDVFFVKFKKGTAQYAKGFSFELMLSDNSGKNIEFKYWGGLDEAKVKAIYDSIKADSIVRVQGRVSVYNNKMQLAANEPNKIEVLEKEQYEDSDFIKKAKKDLNAMYAMLLKEIETIENPKIKELLDSIFKDKETEQKFKKHPGAIEIHHNWVGGLLQHTLEVLEYCKTSAELFPTLDKDLLIAGALLHDIGKLEEIGVTSRIKGTSKGQLAGHLILSSIFVSNKCDELKLDEETKNKLLHIIVSHHGKPEFGSPKEPMFTEALVVYYSDELSSKAAEMAEFIETNKQSTEDDFMYHFRQKKNILLK
ncbi:HD domain-containing protein [archaeon]|nr:HD domain-containing protein [archaeon]